MTKAGLEHYLAPRPRYSALAALVTLGLGLVFGWFVLVGVQRWDESKHLDEQLVQVKGEQAARVVPAPNLQQQEEKKQWVQLRLEKEFPWEKVFRAIERTSSSDIELLEFHPDKLNRVIVLRGEARSMDGLLGYLRDLTVKTGWGGVYLTHQEKVQHGALETISFEIKATIP